MADWDDLRIFLAVARSESLSGAGKALKIDPATVGRRIARLEEALSARLFAKSPARLCPDGRGRAPDAPCRSGRAGDGRRGRRVARRDRRADAARSASARRMAAPTTCCRRWSPRSVTRIRGWRCRSWPCRASSTCRGARPTWPSPSRRPPAGRLTVQKPDRLPPASGRKPRLSGAPRHTADAAPT